MEGGGFEGVAVVPALCARETELRVRLFRGETRIAEFRGHNGDELAEAGGYLEVAAIAMRDLDSEGSGDLIVMGDIFAGAGGHRMRAADVYFFSEGTFARDPAVSAAIEAAEPRSISGVVRAVEAHFAGQ